MISFLCLLLLIISGFALSQDSEDEQQIRAIWLMPNGSESDLTQTFIVDDTITISWTRLHVTDFYMAALCENLFDLWAVPKQDDPFAAQLLQVNVSMTVNGTYDWTLDDVDIGDTGNVIYYLQFKFPTVPPMPRDFFNSSDRRNISSPEFWINHTSSPFSSTALPSSQTTSMPPLTSSSSATTSIAAATSIPSNTGTLNHDANIGLVSGLSALIVIIGGGIASWIFIYMAKKKKNILYESDRADKMAVPKTPPPSGFAVHSEITSHPLHDGQKKPEDMEMKDYYPEHRGNRSQG